MNEKFATNAFHKGLNFVSFVATTFGISSQIGDGSLTLQSVGLAACIAGGIQSVVLFGWPVVGRAVRQRAVLLTGVMLIIVMLGGIASGIFASTSYIQTTRAAFLEQSHQEGLTDSATKVLAPVTTKALDLQQKMLSYEGFAANESVIERTSGTSCDGNRAASKCGPLCRLRAAQAEEAKVQANAMRALVGRINVLRADAVKRRTQDGLIELTVESNAFLNDPTFDEVIRWAEAEKAGFEGVGFRRPEGQLQCRDAAAVTRLNDILTLASARFAPADSPTFRTQTYTDIAAKNVETFLNTVEASLQGKGAFIQTLSEDPARQFWPFWLFAFVIELACALLGLAMVPRAGPFDDPAVDGLPPETKAIVKETYGSCAMWQGNALYFFVPFDGNPILRDNALLLTRKLPMRPFARRGPLALDEVMSEGEARQFHAQTGAKMAEVFVITRPQVAEARVAYGQTFARQDQNVMEGA